MNTRLIRVFSRLQVPVVYNVAKHPQQGLFDGLLAVRFTKTCDKDLKIFYQNVELWSVSCVNIMLGRACC